MTDSKPYQPPQSKVEPTHNPRQNNNELISRTVPLFNGASWIIDGVKNFTMSPFTWLLAVFIYFVIYFTLSMLPFVGIVGLILYPIFIAGLMQCAHENKNNLTFHVKNLFDGFSLSGGKLAGLGALYLGIMIIFFIIFSGIFFSLLFLEGINHIDTAFDINIFIQQYGLILLLLFLIAMAVMLPVIMAFWFSPALIIFHDTNIFSALKLSFRACLKNMLSYLTFSLLFILLYLVAVIPIYIIYGSFNTAIPVEISNDPFSGLFSLIEYNLSLIITLTILVIVELLTLSSIFIASIYASYEDIFEINKPDTVTINA